MRVPPDSSVTVLLAQLTLQGARVAVELNQEIIPRSEYPTRTLKPGDRIEIVQAIGGG